MKKEIHPEYHADAKIICVCGNTIETGATMKEMHTEICGACHPFYTGKEKLVDSAGQVDRFKKKMEKFAAMEKKAKEQKDAKKKTAKKAVKKDTKKVDKKEKKEKK